MDSKTLEKISKERLFFVMKESRFAILASTLCAIIVFIAYSPFKNQWILTSWFIFFLMVNIFRYFLAIKFESNKPSGPYNKFAYWIFITGVSLSGLCWGSSGVLLFPFGDQYQRILLILILAGITAGSTSSLSALIEAAILFLVFTILPFILVISRTNVFAFLLYDITLGAYLIYLIVLCFQARRRTTAIFLLQFEKDNLLKELSKTNKTLRKLATHDFLTNLDNTMLFDEKLSQAIERARRHGKMLAVIFIDLDKFKNINDTLGHDAGNELLVKAAGILKKNLRQTDTLARLGGDEFAVILEDIVYPESVRSIAEKICSLMLKPIEIKNKMVEISVSIGISIFPLDSQDPTELINFADTAMYRIKNNGGNGFEFSNGL